MLGRARLLPSRAAAEWPKPELGRARLLPSRAAAEWPKPERLGRSLALPSNPEKVPNTGQDRS